MHRISHRTAALAALLAALVVAACGGNDAGSADTPPPATEPATGGPTTIEPATTEPTSTEPNSTEPATTPATTGAPVTTDAVDAATTAAVAGPEWVTHRTARPCQCADGSEYVFHTLERDPDKVLLYYQGGGACFSAEMCDFASGTYKVTTDEDDHPNETSGGIFAAHNPSNPLADWSIVFMPYCTGDVFLGDASTAYTDDLTIEHRGWLAASKGLDHVAAHHADAERLLVAGSSAGGIPAPLVAGLASDLLPDAQIAALADASGGYPSNPAVNTAIGALWGIESSIPDWPELEGIDPALFGIPDLFTFAGRHDPSILMARFDNAVDPVQASFSSFAGLEGGLTAVYDLNEQNTEAAGVNLDVYIAPGEGHTVLGSDALYDLEVEGVAFVDWLGSLVDGTAPGDVRCTDCGGPAS